MIVSGALGSETYLLLTNEVLDVAAACDLVTLDETGASTLFVGTTRDHFDGRRVLRLEYEAYDAMAVKELRGVCDAARARWRLCRVAVFHRLGVVPVRHASVVVAVSSAHRAESMDATRFIIDALKARVPIWKREVYDDETGAWKANAEAAARAGGDSSASGAL
jgi:molybdopterin synthase catalytic subunit